VDIIISMLRRDIIIQISSVEAIQSEGSTQMTNKIREGRKGAPSVHAHLGKLLEINTSWLCLGSRALRAIGDLGVARGSEKKGGKNRYGE
jgi:hypothetical protein